MQNAKIIQKNSTILTAMQEGSPIWEAFLPFEALLGPGHPAVLRLRVHKNDIRADFFDAAPWNAEILPSAAEAKQLPGAGDDDGGDFSLRHLHLHILDKAEPASVADADYFLALQLGQFSSHKPPLPVCLLQLMPGEGRI